MHTETRRCREAASRCRPAGFGIDGASDSRPTAEARYEGVHERVKVAGRMLRKAASLVLALLLRPPTGKARVLARAGWAGEKVAFLNILELFCVVVFM